MNPYVPTDQPSNTAPRDRRRGRHAVTALTGLAAAGSLTATGWIAGQAAHAWSAEQQPTSDVPATGDPAATVPQPAARRSRPGRGEPRTVLRQRPTRTRVSTRYVTPAAPVGGGSVGSGSGSSSSGHGSPPAPSSGS